MKLKQITKDTSSGVINLQNTSSSNLYPRLSVGTTVINMVPNFALQDPEDFLSGILNNTPFLLDNTPGLITFKSIKEIVEGFYMTWNRFRKGSVRFQYGYTTSYYYLPFLTPALRLKEYTQPTAISSGDETLIVNKAVELGYNSTSYSDTSYRKKRVYTSNTSTSQFSEDETEINSDIPEISSKSLQGVSESIQSSWNAVKNYSQIEGEIINLDTSITEGSVCPLYLTEGFETGFNCVTGFVYFEDATNNDIYKESFSINTNTTSSTQVHDGIQVILTNPTTSNSVLKLVWDNSLVASAKIIRAKAHKLNK